MGEYDHTDRVGHLGGHARSIPRTQSQHQPCYERRQSGESYQVTFCTLPTGHTELAVGDVTGGSHTSWAAPATRPAKAARIASLANMTGRELARAARERVPVARNWDLGGKSPGLIYDEGLGRSSRSVRQDHGEPDGA